MSDIVDDLNHYIRAGFDPHGQMKDARSEIERLRAGYERLEHILTKQSLAADERASDALALVRYINTCRAALATGGERE